MKPIEPACRTSFTGLGSSRSSRFTAILTVLLLVLGSCVDAGDPVGLRAPEGDPDLSRGALKTWAVKLSVAAPSGSGLPGATAVATNVLTGQFYYGITAQDGTVTLNVPEASYIFSAYSYRVTNPEQLFVWPSKETIPIVSSVADYAPVIWHPTEGSLLKTEENLLRAAANPISIGSGRTLTIPLVFGGGETVQCVLLDENGNNLGSKPGARIFGFTPVASNQALPPRYLLDTTDWTEEQIQSLPRGIGFRAAELQNGCTLTGAARGIVAIESNRIDAGGVNRVYRASAVVGDGQNRLIAGPSPELVQAKWHVDELIGDAIGPQDFGGAIVFGWGKTGALPVNGNFAPSDRFSVSTQFRGNGSYTLELWRDEPNVDSDAPAGRLPDVVATASCAAKKCSLASTSLSPRSNISVGVTGVSVADSEEGTVVWSVDWPGVPEGDIFHFRIYSGSVNSPSDVLDGPLLNGTKRSGRAESYILAGLM